MLWCCVCVLRGSKAHDATDMAAHAQAQPLQQSFDDWEAVSPVADAVFEGTPIHESHVMPADFAAASTTSELPLLPPTLWTIPAIPTLRARPAALYVVFSSERDTRQQLWSLMQAERGVVVLPGDELERLRALWGNVYGDVAFRPRNSCVSPDDMCVSTRRARSRVYV